MNNNSSFHLYEDVFQLLKEKHLGKLNLIKSWHSEKDAFFPIALF